MRIGLFPTNIWRGFDVRKCMILSRTRLVHIAGPPLATSHRPPRTLRRSGIRRPDSLLALWRSRPHECCCGRKAEIPNGESIFPLEAMSRPAPRSVVPGRAPGLPGGRPVSRGRHVGGRVALFGEEGGRDGRDFSASRALCAPLCKSIPIGASTASARKQIACR